MTDEISKEDFPIEAAMSAPGNLRLEDPSRSVARRLDNLPVEMLDEILNGCEHKEPFKGELSKDHYPTNGDRPILKTLRLVNKIMNEVATPRLFKSLTLYQHEGYWKGLEDIANDANLAGMVKHINIAHIGYLTRIESLDEWALATEGLRGPKGDLATHPPAGGPLADWDYSSEVAWERYQLWRDDELAMQQHDDAKTAPKVPLEKLLNLKSVETVGLYRLMTVERKPSCSGRDLMACGKDLTKLVLHRVQELWNVTEKGLGLPSLKHLVIDTSNVKMHTPEEAETREVSPWILDLDNLRTLQIKQNPHALYNPDLCLFLRRAKWPKLRRLELTTVQTSLVSLRDFVSGRLGQVEYVSISVLRMGIEDWRSLETEAANWSSRHGESRIVLSRTLYSIRR